MYTHDGNEPIRINRFLLLQNVCSRRQADRYIAAGQVFINGVRAELGSKVQPGDKVKVGKNILKDKDTRLYIAFNKPQGVVSHNPQPGQQGVEDILKLDAKVSPIGRLDRDSRGLMLLSNDGTIVDKILNPKNEHEKEYIVKVNKPLKTNFERLMSSGLNLGTFRTKPCIVERMGDKTFRIILTEGKKHQIRRMCDKLGYAVTDLERVRIANIKLDKLKPGDHRELTPAEKDKLFAFFEHKS